MKSSGFDPLNKEDRLRYAQQLMNEFKLDMSGFIRALNPNCSIFYNAGHVGPAVKASMSAYTHLELESLPSGGWGYMHFPITVRYARNLGPDVLGQTGKFHTSWGDFHSFKNKEALEFECFTMLAHGAKCMIGDQLEPNGVLSEHVYDLIGSVYSQVEQVEPWCRGSKPIVDIGVFTPEEYAGPGHWGLVPLSRAARILQRAGHQFDVIDSNPICPAIECWFSQTKYRYLPSSLTGSSAISIKGDRSSHPSSRVSTKTRPSLL